jgi:hypothetical protein
MFVSVEEDTCFGTCFTTCGGGYLFVSVEEDTCLCLWRRILAYFLHYLWRRIRVCASGGGYMFLFPWMRILALVLALLLVEEDTCLRLRISAVNIRRLIIFSSLHWFFNHPFFFCIVRACLLVCVCVYACVSFSPIHSLSLGVYMYAHLLVCVPICSCARRFLREFVVLKKTLLVRVPVCSCARPFPRILMSCLFRVCVCVCVYACASFSPIPLFLRARIFAPDPPRVVFHPSPLELFYFFLSNAFFPCLFWAGSRRKKRWKGRRR